MGTADILAFPSPSSSNLTVPGTSSKLNFTVSGGGIKVATCNKEAAFDIAAIDGASGAPVSLDAEPIAVVIRGGTGLMRCKIVREGGLVLIN
mgnify:FL=1